MITLRFPEHAEDLVSFEVAAEHPDACFGDQLDRVAAIGADDVASELARTLVDTSRWSGPELARDAGARNASRIAL